MGKCLESVYRNENKFYISLQEYYYISQLVQAVLQPDSFMKKDRQYYIRSLYFDSVDNIDYYSKLSGIEMRKKIRLRIYDIDSEFVKLEIKNRLNSNILKETVVISRAEAESLIKGDYMCLDSYNEAIALKIKNILTSQVYSPKMIVDYEREAYVYPEHNVRITFDKNVRAICSDKLFEKTLGLVPIITEPYMIMEIKYGQVLPEFIKKAVSTGTLLKASISKYCIAREMLM